MRVCMWGGCESVQVGRSEWGGREGVQMGSV